MGSKSSFTILLLGQIRAGVGTTLADNLISVNPLLNVSAANPLNGKQAVDFAQDNGGTVTIELFLRV